ncbi:MAG: ABC transporter substrate-binding protein, partial [Propionibacteriales bacterium]|nr:ABC transporter substrate-binding protein [Propionibacteriales bacterium]
ADEAADQAGSPYPQVSAEYLLTSDPDLVLLADNECCGVTPEQVAERPGWDALTAVQNDAVVVVNEDIASRWGPRVPDFFEDVAAAIGTVRGGG